MRANVLTLVLALAASRASNAQPANGASAEAEALFRQGVALMDAGQIAEACAAFDASQQRAPATTTLFNQAACREKNEQFATAWGWYVEAERETRESTDPTTQTLHQVAQDHASKLEPKLSKLTIKVPVQTRIPGLEIRREAVVVELEAAGRALPIDGGRYTITAHAPGYESWKMTIEIKPEGDAKTIDIPPLHVIAEPVVKPRSRTVPLVLAGSALLLLGTAVVFELSAESTYNDYREVGGASPLFDSANHKRYAAEALAVGGLSCAAVGAWLYFRGASRESNTGRRIAIAPNVDGGRAGVLIFGRY